MSESNQTAVSAHRPAHAQRSSATSAMLAPLAAIVILGAALRISQLHQSLFSDELWSYVGATQASIDQVLDWVRSDQEITPPLYTVLAWLSAKVGDPTVMIRLPSLLGGIVTIPLTYVLGLRTIGSRGAACLAALLVALSPFLLWHSVEARAYGLAVALVVASTVSLLAAIDKESWPWWVAYAGFSCAAMYTHYTAVFVLSAQFAWSLWFHREVWRQATVANLAAAVAFFPWLPSLLDDFDSPSQKTIEGLVPFSLDTFIDSTARVAFGQMWGPAVASPWAKAALVCGFAIAIGGALFSWRAARQRDPRPPWRFEALSLVVMLAVAAPVGLAVSSLIGNDMYLPRNLATSWPGLAVAMAALLTTGATVVRAVAITLVVGAFAYGAIRTTEPSLQRPGFRDAAAFIDENAGPSDLVLEVNPLFLRRTHEGPLQPATLTLDVNFEEPHKAIDYLNPTDGRRALRGSAGRRLVLSGISWFVLPVRDKLGLSDATPVARRSYQGVLPMTVEVFNIPSSSDPTPVARSQRANDR